MFGAKGLGFQQTLQENRGVGHGVFLHVLFDNDAFRVRLFVLAGNPRLGR